MDKATDPSGAGGSARRPIAMLTHSYYEEDPRVRREAEALAAAGHAVDVYALRRPSDPGQETIAGVSVRRLGVQRHQGAGLGVYLAEYLAFFLRAGFALVRAHPRRRYGLVQVHTLPDFLVFATLPLRMVGVPVILDLHEAMPVFFGSRFHSRLGGIARAVLGLQERMATRYASAVITVNEALGDRLLGLGVPAGKLTIVPNVPSLARFDPAASPARPFMADGRLVLVYAGGLSPIYELDVVLDAIADPARPTAGARRSPSSCTGGTSRRCRSTTRPSASGSPTRSPSTGASRSARSPRRSRPPTSAWRPPAGPSSPTTRSRPRRTSTPRWTGSWSRAACRSSSAPSATTS